MTGQEGLCRAPLQLPLADRIFHETVQRQENLAVVRAASGLYKSTEKNDPVSEILDTKEMTNSICYPKIT